MKIVRQESFVKRRLIPINLFNVDFFHCWKFEKRCQNVASGVISLAFLTQKGIKYLISTALDFAHDTVLPLRDNPYTDIREELLVL